MKWGISMEEEGIALSEIIKMLFKNWILLLLFSILGVVLGVCYTFFIMEEEYTSQSSILVIMSNGEDPKEYDYNSSLMIINTVSELAKQSIILSKVSEQTNTDMNELSNMIVIEHPSSSLVLLITVHAKDEKQALNIANIIADVLIKECKENSSLGMIGDSLLKTSDASKPIYTGHNKFICICFFIVGFMVLGVIISISKEMLLQKKKINSKNDKKVVNQLENILN